jgi:hypothetical protein
MVFGKSFEAQGIKLLSPLWKTLVIALFVTSPACGERQPQRVETPSSPAPRATSLTSAPPAQATPPPTVAEPGAESEQPMEDDAEFQKKADELLGRPNAIHGGDDRVDILEANNKRARADAKAVVLVTADTVLKEFKNGDFQMITKSYKEAAKVCDEVPFKEQPVPWGGPLGSGFLVAPDVIVTAQHVVRRIQEWSNAKDPNDASGLRFIFDFRAVGGKTDTVLKAANVYKGARVLRAGHPWIPGGQGDWALIKLESEVKGRTPLVPSKSPPSKYQLIYMIGHPHGLPQKYNDKAIIRRAKTDTFVANLDGLSGNSGSPIFDLRNGGFLGIEVKDDVSDFFDNGKCKTLRVCRNTGCHGGGVTVVSASAFVPFLESTSSGARTDSGVKQEGFNEG